MVAELARQSVIIKSRNITSVILGNYECGYCLGIVAKMAGLTMDDTYSDMTVWFQDVMDQIADFQTEDENLKQVLRMLSILEPEPMIDDQVKLLYRMGYEEARPWEI